MVFWINASNINFFLFCPTDKIVILKPDGIFNAEKSNDVNPNSSTNSHSGKSTVPEFHLKTFRLKNGYATTVLVMLNWENLIFGSLDNLLSF